MNRTETDVLLAVAAAFDYRTIGETDAMAWHAALYDVEFGPAREAVIRHYRQHADRITPADIRHLTNPDAHNKPVPPPPDNIAANPAEWRKRVTAAGIQGPLANQQRRDLVLAYPHIAKRLCDPPLSLKHPRQWTGFIPADTYEGGGRGQVPNPSPVRAQLADILQAAAEAADADAEPPF